MRRPPRVASLLLLGGLGLTGVACGGGGGGGSSSDAAPGEVLVVDNEFEPKRAEVAVGDTVTWRFEGTQRHNISPIGDNRKTWEASKVQKEGTFTWTFDEAGTYKYVCTLHSGMTGSVTVA